MEKEKAEFEQDEIHFIQGADIAGIGIDIYSDSIEPTVDSAGIPSFEFYEEPRSNFENTVYHRNSDNIELKYDNENNNFFFDCPTDLIKSGRCLLFLALSLSERERQLRGQLLSHGAGIASPSGQGILLLGNQGAGKTTLALNLCKRNFSLIGNDQVFIGPKAQDDELMLLGGTKYITVRETALGRNNLDSYNLQFNSSTISKWNNKKTYTCNDLGIRSTQTPTKIEKTLIIHMDATGKEELTINRMSPFSIRTNLFLAEKFSRHISGVATHLLSDNGELLCLTPSLDNAITQQARLKIIRDLYDIGVYEVSGGNVEEMLDQIEHLLIKSEKRV